MANNVVIFGNETIMDISPTTAVETDVAQGKIFFKADGSQATGVASGGSSQHIYCGSSSPSSSIGEDGDVYIQLFGGGSIEVYPLEYTATNMNSTSNLGNCIGTSAADGSSTSNAYSSGNNVTGVVDYTFDLTNIPSTATITSLFCQVKAHEENSSRSSFTLQLYSGSTAKGSETTVNGTSNTIYTLTTGTWSRTEIDELILKMQVGYYGGLIAGATLTVSYTSEPTFEVKLIGTESSWSISGSGIYKKSGSTWNSVSSTILDDNIQKA